MKNLKTKLEKSFKDKLVFVTGHTGFKGSWLCEILILLGARVVGYSLAPGTNPSLFEQLNLENRVDNNIFDIRDKDNLIKKIVESQPDYLFHLAAQPLVRTSYKQPIETYEINVMGTIHILEALRNLEKDYKKINKTCASVFVTTDKCYENKEWESSYRESDQLGGYDPYSSSKAAAEIAISAYRSSYMNANKKYIDGLNLPKIGISSARAGNVIGGGDWAQDRIIPDCIRYLLKNEKIIVRNPLNTRPWQHVLDPLFGYLLLASIQKNALDKKDKRNIIKTCDSFNFGPPLNSNVSVENLIEELLKHWPGNWQEDINQDNLHEAGKLNLAWDKAYHILDWHPKWFLKDSVNKTVIWYKDVLKNNKSPYDCVLRDINSYLSC